MVPNLIDLPAFRSLVWRLGRRLYCWARREGANNPQTNGEYWLLERVVRGANHAPLVLFDVGANKGNWSAQALTMLTRHHQPGMIHAFEPDRSSFEYASKRFADDKTLHVHQAALSNQAGEQAFYVSAPLAETNSLHPIEGASVASVRTQTLDGFLAAHGIDHVTMVKSDTEGHDLSVLEGARSALEQGRIDVWQFEYNHSWPLSRATLKAVYDLTKGMPYHIGKLYGDGIEVYEACHFELDRYFQTNYLLIRHGSAIESLVTRMYFDRHGVARPRG